MKVAITQQLRRTFNNNPYRWGIVILVVTRFWKGGGRHRCSGERQVGDGEGGSRSVPRWTVPRTLQWTQWSTREPATTHHLHLYTSLTPSHASQITTGAAFSWSVSFFWSNSVFGKSTTWVLWSREKSDFARSVTSVSSARDFFCLWVIPPCSLRRCPLDKHRGSGADKDTTGRRLR